MMKRDLINIIGKINVKTVGIALFTALLILTFVSKTIYNYSLPVVTATMPLKGKIEKTETVKGIAGWAETAVVYADAGGYVDEIFVKEGDSVTKGQALMKLTLTEDALAKYREKAYELQQLEMDIKNAEEDRNIMKALYEEGAIPEKEYKEKERNLQAMYIKKQKLLLDYNNTMQYSSLTVHAGEDSIVSDITVHKGQKVSEGEAVATCGISLDYKVNCNISMDNNFVMEGDRCRLENSSHSLEGIVTDVTTSETGKDVSVLLQSADAMKGETFDVIFEKESAGSFTLVPNGALNRDSDGYFLYQIKQRKGMLGKEFYVEKLRVYIGDNDNENTVITDGITFFEPVVLFCDKEISEGDIIILENEGDFFAD